MGFFRRHRRKIIAASIVTGIFGAGFGLAHGAHRHGWPVEMMMSHLEKLHDGLQLNVNQEVLWKQATTQTRSIASQAMEQHGQMREAFKAALDTPNVDLRLLTEKADRMRADADATRREVRDLWLAVYDSLDAAQKEKVRVFMKDRAERFGRFRAHFRDEAARWHERDRTNG